MRRGVSAVLVAIVSAAGPIGCGSSSPTSPEVVPGGGSAGYQNRPMWFNISPADLSGAGNEPTVPACVGSAAAGLGGPVMVPMVGTLDGDVFTAEAPSGSRDTLRIRLQRTVTMGGGSGLSFSTPMAGWIDGSATHQNIPGVALGAWPASMVRFDGRVQVTADMHPDGSTLAGRVTGLVTFVSETGTEVRCNAGTVFWHLTRMGGS